MAVRDIIQAAGGSVATGPAVYVEDVFSTYLYNGTGASQTITNGIDLATKGGLVWIKSRTGSNNNHQIWDTVRGTNLLLSDNTSGHSAQGPYAPTFLTSGYIDNWGYTSSVASWTFRKQAKFFDVVTYTGTGSARTISHALGSVPGMIIVKRTDTTGNWQVYHRSLTSAANSIQLNLTNAQASATTVWNSTAPTSSVFSVGTDVTVNASGGTYVAYLFAHDAGGFGAAGTDSVVACGSYTGNGSASGPTVTLGWEPQFVIVKNASATGDWNMFDNMRGIPTGSADPYLFANTFGVEATANGDLIDLTPTGFVIKSTNSQVNTSSGTYIYLAIRRGPMRTPTDATKVFAVNTRSGTGAVATVTNAGFPVDLLLPEFRSGSVASRSLYDRLRGKLQLLATSGTAAEVSDVNGVTGFDSMTGYLLGADTNQGSCNYSSTNYVDLAFRRAPGFFDVVCYTGTGSARTVAHNLGVAPELMIFKSRSAAINWAVYHYAIGATQAIYLNATYGPTFGGSFFNGTAPTSTQFTVNLSSATNDTAATYVAYLFATCPGVSKVGSYTGSGTTKQIDCGFASGARFVMIKRADSTGDWYVWDTARGIVSANDPYLLMNSTAAEVTNTDYIDPYSAGFEISSTAPAAINASGGTYIYLAIA